MYKLDFDSIWVFDASQYKFGLGAISEIGFEMNRLGGSRVLLVTDQGLMKVGIPQIVQSHIKKQGIKLSIWDGVESEPSVKSIEQGIHWCQDKEFDAFISVGGGSSIDSTKVLNLILSNGGEIIDYVAPPTGLGKTPTVPLKPHIAVPTTAGTGSETSPASVIMLQEKMLKVGISNPKCKPDLALVDPILHTSMSPKVTTDSGMDALSHAIEAYITRRYNMKPKPKTPQERPVYGGGTLLTDLFAEKAIELVGKYLHQAVCNGYDLEARTQMALAASLAGIAFTNAGLTAVHAMAFPIGGQFHTAHGETIAVILPAVMDFFSRSIPEKFATIAQLMGENIEGLPIHDAANKSITTIIKLMKSIDTPNGLSAFGITVKDLPQMAEDTLKIRRLLAGNPQQLTKDNLLKVFRKALKYW
jgi:alcohol dehydrogenase class IV